MDISSQLPRLPLLDLQTRSPTRPSSAISAVLGPGEQIDAVVRHVVRLNATVASDPRQGQQQRQDLYRVVLQVESRNIEVLTNRALQPGQQLSIRASTSGEVLVTAVDGRAVDARQTSASSPPSPRGADLVSTLVSALRQHLPAQQASAPLLRNLALLLTQTPNPTTPAGPQTAAAASQAAGGIATGTPINTSPPGASITPRNTAPPPYVPETTTQPGAARPTQTTASAAREPAALPRLPQAVTTALQKLLTTLPTPAQITEPRGLQQAVQNSGLFLEARLQDVVRTAAASRADPRPAAERVIQSDFKAGLIRAFNVLESQARNHAIPQLPRQGAPLTPEQVLRVLALAPARNAPAATAPAAGTVAGNLASETLQLGFPAPISVAGAAPTIPAGGSMDLALSVLLRQLAANISRITVQQVQTSAAQQGAGAEPGAVNSWQIELPVRHGDGLQVFQIRIDEEERHEKDEQDEEEKIRQWKVTLAFDLAPLGPMYAQIRLWEQNVATRFWAERQSTLQAVRSELDTLKEKLSGLGLHVEELDCMEGAPPVRKTTLSQQLVDIRT